MVKFVHIDDESMYPNESDHVEHPVVYRAIKSSDVLRIQDFLPWNIEHTNQKKTFKNQFKQPQYGMSVFTDLDSLKRIVKKYPAMNDSIKAFAKGFTSIKRGISYKEDSKHHVEYFLYDYDNNSPKDDFIIVEVREHG